jgi:localization factor PodJL
MIRRLLAAATNFGSNPGSDPVGENMSKAGPWGVKGLGFDVREAAQEAARREGMTLSEWLSETISERAHAVGIESDDLADDDRLEAVADRLRELDRQNRATGERRRYRGRARQEALDDDEEPRPPMRRRDMNNRSMNDRSMSDRGANDHNMNDRGMAAPQASISAFDAEALLERTVERFQRENAKSQRRTADALASVARVMEANEMRRQDERAALETVSRRLGDIESNLSRRSADDDADNLKTSLVRLEMRLDAMARRTAPEVRKAPPKWEPPPPSRVEMRATASPRSLGEAIAQIAQRQRDLEETAAHSPSRSNMPLEPALAVAESYARPASQADVLALADKIEAIRRDMMREPPAKSAPAFDLDKLHAEIAQMSTALHDLATQGSVAALEASIRRLAEQIDVSRREGANEAVLRPLERVVADLRRGLAEVDPRTTIAGLESQIRALDSKLENLGRPNLDPDAFLQVQQQTREIRDLLTAAAARPTPGDRIEQQVAQLAHKLDQQQQITALLSDGRAAGAVAEGLPQLFKEGAFEGLSERLDAVAARVEAAMHAGSSAHQSANTRGLEDLVRGLAEKIEAVRAPQSDTRAIEALERQIGELATRLDRSSTGLSSLPYLQQAIGDLFVKLEATQQVTVEAAEAAARNAVQESLREALAQGAFDQRPLFGNTDTGPDGVSRELSELRDLQDAADRRTHSTLNAVHETLEKVVDRLAMLEDELGDVRSENPPPTLASGPAPRFATSSRNDPPMAPNAPDAGNRDRARADERPAKPGRGEDLEDFLIEPGRGFPGREAEPNNANDKKRKSDRRPGVADSAVTGRADFIAAARRAAQAAQVESAAAAADARSAADDGKGETPQNLIAQARQFITRHKRPVVLSVAAVFLLVGAYAVFNTMGASMSGDAARDTPKPAPQDHAQNVVPAPHAEAAQQAASLFAPAPKPAAAVDAQQAPAIPGSDPIIVGTIGKPSPAAPETTHDMALAALQSAADLGNAKAQFEIASRYAEGRGVTRDLKTAAQYYQKAATQGLVPAQYRLGSFFEKGAGFPRDLVQAKAWYLKAAEQGNVRAMHNLAVLLAEVGDNGKPDYAGAAQWFRKAAEFGVRDSQYNYAILLARGLGVGQNLASSYTWFAIAAAQGDQDAGKKRDDVGGRLSAEDLAASKAVAEGFHAKTADSAANEAQWPVPVTAPPATAKPQKPKVSQL